MNKKIILEKINHESHMIINSGIKKIIYKEKYPDELARKMLKEAGVVEIYYE